MSLNSMFRREALDRMELRTDSRLNGVREALDQNPRSFYGKQIFVVFFLEMCNCNKKFGAPKPTVSAPAPAPAPDPAPAPMLMSLAPDPVPDGIPSVDTAIWGPPLWKILHILSQYTGTPPHIQLWYSIIGAMRTAIPCEECRSHFQARSRAYPLRIRHYVGGIHNAVIRWTLDLHNFVNRATNSSNGEWSLDDCRRVYGGADKASRLTEARTALDAIRGVAGDELIVALDRALRILSR